MKFLAAALFAALLLVAAAPASRAQQHHQATRDVLHEDFDEPTRFIFYSVLEGLYEDGLSDADVDQILLRHGNLYAHFIYACPICTTTIWALETYRSRPERFKFIKADDSTFGPGMPAALHHQLYSENVHERLTAINTLMQGWMSRRMALMHLSDADHAALLAGLEKKRQAGMDVLESFRHHEHGADFGVAEAAPAYVDLTECAVCNGAVGKIMKMPGDPATPPPAATPP